MRTMLFSTKLICDFNSKICNLNCQTFKSQTFSIMIISVETKENKLRIVKLNWITIGDFNSFRIKCQNGKDSLWTVFMFDFFKKQHNFFIVQIPASFRMKDSRNAFLFGDCSLFWRDYFNDIIKMTVSSTITFSSILAGKFTVLILQTQVVLLNRVWGAYWKSR